MGTIWYLVETFSGTCSVDLEFNFTMAEMNKEPADTINFATAKSLFQKDNVKAAPKSPSSTSSSSSSPLTININIANGGKTENKVKNPLQAPSGGVEDRSEGWKTSGSSSFDSPTEAPKINFVLPKKRGDTSDLRWLTAVHNSTPLGTAALSEKAKSSTKETNRGPQRNQAHLINGAGLPASTHGKSKDLSLIAKYFHVIFLIVCMIVLLPRNPLLLEIWPLSSLMNLFMVFAGENALKDIL